LGHRNGGCSQSGDQTEQEKANDVEHAGCRLKADGNDKFAPVAWEKQPKGRPDRALCAE
jgi:hypothetical protein